MKKHIKSFKDDMNSVWVAIKGQDNYIKFVGIACLALILTTISITLFSKQTAPERTSPSNAILKELDVPKGYNEPFPTIVQSEPEVREIIKYIEPEPEPEIKYKAEDIFNFNKKPIQKIDQDDLKRADIQDKRKSYTWERKKKVWSPYDYIKDYEDQSQDLDFSSLNRPRSTPTYPVNLDRVFTSDRWIPAVTMTEIKSELASQKVIAQIESDVYASHGRKILIPRGSRAIGSYEPLDEQGSTRLQIVWDRILTPQGIDIKLDSETADQQGASGLTGSVDERRKDRYGSALLFSSISALAQLTVSAGNEQQAAAADAFTGEFGTLTAELLRNSLDIVPRVTIQRGTRLLISPLTDLWFKPATIGEVQVVKIKKGELQ